MLPQLRIDNNSNKPVFDTIVHLGAGLCGELDDYLSKQPGRVLLVEADPQMAEKLRNRTKDRKSVKVTCAALSGHPGPATFNRYNLPEASSLHAPNKLIELFPGLKTVGQLKVDTISPDSLLNPLNLNSEQENLLVIDLPGEELPVLKTLQRSRKLHLFSQVILHCGCRPLYMDSSPATKVLEWLRNQCFDLVAQNETIDPDRPYWTLQRNMMQLQNAKLRDKAERLSEKNEKLENNAASQQDRVEFLTKELDSQKKQSEGRDAQIERLKEAIEEQTRLEADHEQQYEELRRDRDEQAGLTAEFQAQIPELIQLRDDLEKLADERKARIDALIKDRDDYAKLASDGEQQIAELLRNRDKQANCAVEHQARISELIKARDEQTKLSGEQKARLDRLAKACDEQTRIAGDLQQQLAKVNQDRDRQAEYAAKRQSQISDLTSSKDMVSKLSKELEAKLEDLNKAYNRQVKIASDKENELSTLRRERDKQANLIVERESKISDLVKSKEEQVKIAGELLAKVDFLVSQQHNTQSKSPAGHSKQTPEVCENRNKPTNIAKDRQKQINEHAEPIDDQAQSASNYASDKKQLTIEIQKAKRLTQDQKQKIVELKNARQEQDKVINKLNSQLTEAQKTATHATKLQMIRESDLKDLQMQHKKAMSVLKHHEHLFHQIEERLKSAAIYFNQMKAAESNSICHRNSISYHKKRRSLKKFTQTH